MKQQQWGAQNQAYSITRKEGDYREEQNLISNIAQSHIMCVYKHT